ncbi:MAG TPA: hypothetical protein VGK59_17675, partial [Ohtaekwangia sp.]
MEITVNSADGGQAQLIFLDAPGAGNDLFNQFINVGNTLQVNATRTLPDGTYQFIIQDIMGNFAINTFAAPASYPPIVLTDITSPALSEDIRIDNSSCSFPTTGQIQSSISGGSKTLAGGGSYTYTWSADNSLAGLPLTGVTDGNTPLNLSALLGVSGLPGGNYTLVVEDNYSQCSASRSFTLSDPSPTVFNITTTSPQNVCAGGNITVTLNNSDGPSVTYQIFRNGVGTGITFSGTGSGPFVMTFPSTSFSDNDVISVRATDGFCSPATMNGNVLLNINPLPTATISATPSPICIGQSSTLTFTLTGTAPFNVSYSDGTTTFNLTGISNGHTVPVSPTINTTYTITSVSDATTCTGAGGSSASVTVNPLPTATISASPSPICSGLSSTLTFTLTGTAPFNVSYNDGTTTFNLAGISTGHTVSVSPTSSTTYTIVSVSDATTCTGAGGSATTVNVNIPPTSAALSGTTTICAGQSTNLSVAIVGGLPPYSFTIDNGVGLITGYASGSPIAVSPGTTTTYAIVGNVTDAAGCTVTPTGSAIITVNPLPT